MNIVISIFYLLMCVYFRYGTNPEIKAITYSDIVSGSFFFSLWYGMVAYLAYSKIPKIGSSINVLSAYTLIVFSGLMILREIYIVINGVSAFYSIINSWEASFYLTIFCLLLNLLLLFVKWKR